MKSGSADMWWIIIGAVIALVVLIVLLVIFTGRTTGLEQGLLSCESKGGICVADNTCRTEHQGTATNAFECTGEDECCFGCKVDCES